MAKKRKTREQKIIAQLRRELQGTKKELKQFKKEEVIKKKPEKGKPLKKKRIKKSESSALPASPADRYPLTSLPCRQAGNLYLRKDLTKTLILSILAIGIELMIYWLTIKGFDIFNLPAQLKTKFF